MTVPKIDRWLPASKPQLWAHLPRAISRKLQVELRKRLDPAWLDRPTTVRLANSSLRMRVTPRDSLGAAIYLYGVMEVALTTFVGRALHPGDVFVDVGANAGYYTLRAAELVGPGGHVFAFEPSPLIGSLLRDNVQLNSLENVTVRGEAVWSSCGEVSFFPSSDPHNSGTSSVLAGRGPAAEHIKVPAVTLDSVVSNLRSKLAFVKIDVEGGEAAVFQGAEGMLSSGEDFLIAFECFDVDAVRHQLAAHGFAVHSLAWSRERRSVVLVTPGTKVDDPMASYEAPTFIAARRGSRRLARVLDAFGLATA